VTGRPTSLVAADVRNLCTTGHNLTQSKNAALDTARLDANGFVPLSTSPSLSTLEVARLLGDILHLEGIAEVQTLTPRHAEEVGKNRYSGLYGTESFPLHTDMAHWYIPPRYLLLRCVRAAENVATYFVHSREVFGPESE